MELIECKICGYEMKNFINPSHLKNKHGISLNEYKTQYPNINLGKRIQKTEKYTCMECNVVCGSSSVLSKHIKNHNLNLEQYYIKYFSNKKIPTCQCGCGKKTEFKSIKYGFYEYIHNHSSPYKHGNEFYKKRKIFKPWNKGLTKESSELIKKTSLKIKNAWNENNLKQRTDSYKKTMVKRYGVINGFQHKDIKDKSKKTMIKRYGVENPQFSSYLKYNWKSYVLPSGKVIKCQGYEPFFLNIFLKNHKEEELISQKENVPKIEYMEEGKVRKYCPDFYIPSKREIIEVKSEYTYKLHKNNIYNKKKYVIKNGYKFKLYVFDESGTLLKYSKL